MKAKLVSPSHVESTLGLGGELHSKQQVIPIYPLPRRAFLRLTYIEDNFITKLHVILFNVCTIATHSHT